MKQNIGNTDKIVRIIAGVALLSLLVLMEGDAKWLGLIGLVPIGTALIGWCPLYVPLGLSTKCGKGECCGGGNCGSKTE
ncbi:MAG TPA: DUF2892 domain-containing protein [Alphaproteobacteria bacterium]|nr:DUF2892 domain-containing protein [Alphaproteobacteria bacterium]HNS45126.1 DUF2892 domain-containing protein [Alphaproteobacteria bacterium]